MFHTSRHPSDEELLQFIDSELPPNHVERLQKHLAVCLECQERKESIESRLKTLHEFYGSEEIAQEAKFDGSRIKLQEKLAQHRRNPLRPHVQAPLVHVPFVQPRLPITALAMLVVIGLIFLPEKHLWRSRSGAWSRGHEILTPNSSLTPGAVRPVTLNEICPAAESDDLDPKVSLSTERAVLKEYGLPPDTAAARNYQIDYLVNPQLGGTDDMRNLWPQPYSNDGWNAHAKDMLEQHLHQMVCSRAIDLADAQRELAADWIAAYKKYLGKVGS